MIGFWYNKDAFSKAGIDAPPTTWADFLADVTKLKASGIFPLAIAGQDKWPSMHLWTYLLLRNGGGDTLSQMIQSGDWNTDACTKAGEDVLALNALNPYQDGFKSAVYNDEAASVGNGKSAMELMGQWAPSVQRDQSADKKGIGDKLGWFPFPSVDGGTGAATDGVGGGNGIAVGKDAPPEAIDFLKFFNSVETTTSSTPTASPSRRPSAPRAPSPTRTCRPSSPVAARRVHAAVPRPGDLPGAWPRDQRRHRGAVPREVQPADACKAITDAAATQ